MSVTQAQRAFSIESAERDGTIELRMAGECDLASVPELSHAIEAAEDVHRVVIDLGGLTFIDSSGLRVLAYAVEDARRDGRRISLKPGSPEVMRVFEITGLAETLPFE